MSRCLKSWGPWGVLALLAAICGPGDAHGQSRQRVSTTTPNGLVLPESSTMLVDIGGSLDEESLIALNGQTARIITPGDLGILQLWDQDGGGGEFLRITNASIVWSDRGAGVDTAPRRLINDNDGDLELQTDGAHMNFYLDVDDDNYNPGPVMRFHWFDGGMATSNRRMVLDNEGFLHLDGGLIENYSFDLAEAFLKTEEIAAGQLVAVAAGRHDAVRLTTGADDRAVIGVVSTKPGVLMGGGAFSVAQMEANWGADHVARFRSEQAGLQERVLAEREDLRTLQSRVASLATFSPGYLGFAADESIIVDEATPPTPERPRTVKRVDWERLVTAYADEQAKFAGELEAAAIDLFLKETLVPVALSGRVPVQVDGSFGSIQAGDYLAPSPVPGVAMKATLAGPTIGVALEAFRGERGQVAMLVQRGWYGGESPKPGPSQLAGSFASVDQVDCADTGRDTRQDEELAALQAESTVLSLRSQAAESQAADLLRRLTAIEARLAVQP